MVPIPELHAGGEPGKYKFHRFIKLDELTVVGVEDQETDGRTFELLSPEKSFAVIAG